MHVTAEQASAEKQVPLSHRTPSNERKKSNDASPRDLHGFKVSTVIGKPSCIAYHRANHNVCQWALAYTAMLSTTFLFALDNTIVADIQPSILRDFDSIELLPWIGTGFALGTTAILPWGKAYGIFNIRWLYIFNILLFEVGSAICGAAPTINALIVGRVIAGIGGSGMYSGTLMYVSLLTSTSEKAAYLSGSTVIWGVGSVLGPVVGDSLCWRQVQEYYAHINTGRRRLRNQLGNLEMGMYLTTVFSYKCLSLWLIARCCLGVLHQSRSWRRFCACIFVPVSNDRPSTRKNILAETAHGRFRHGCGIPCRCSVFDACHIFWRHGIPFRKWSNHCPLRSGSCLPCCIDVSAQVPPRHRRGQSAVSGSLLPKPRPCQHASSSISVFRHYSGKLTSLNSY